MLAASRIAPRSKSLFRSLSTLPSNTYIKVFNSPSHPPSHILTYLDTSPPSTKLAIGSSTALPPTPDSFTENAHFAAILRDVVAEYGHQDDDVISQARTLSGPAGAGRGGFVHLSDRRNPPDPGRTAWPEDILGSVEVDRRGQVIGKLQSSGTYRMVTNEGILGLSPFLTEKLIARLKREEEKEKGSG